MLGYSATFFLSKFVCWISTIATNWCGYSIFYYRFVCVYAQLRYLRRRFRWIWQTTTPRTAISARAIRTPRMTGKLLGSSWPPCEISGKKTTTNKQTNKQTKTNKTKNKTTTTKTKNQEHLNHISHTLNYYNNNHNCHRRRRHHFPRRGTVG